MTDVPHSDHFYQVGSNLSYQHPSYVTRQADHKLYQALLDRQFCYVLNSRQMGKSSLQIRVRHQLAQTRITCAEIDIMLINDDQTTVQQWYKNLIGEIVTACDLTLNLQGWWKAHQSLSPSRCLSLFIEEVLLVQIQTPIVLCVDEIDSVLKLRFAIDDFFGVIKHCYRRRTSHPEYQRLTWVLLGVASPHTLINDFQLTPFNIGKAIHLTGFTLTEAMPLAQGLQGISAHPVTVLREVLAWTGGQPFLTQKLCKQIAEAGTIPGGEEANYVDQVVQSSIVNHWEFHDQPEHLTTIRDRLLRREDRAVQLLGAYQQVLERGSILANECPQSLELCLTGLVTQQNNQLTAYNRIYTAIFDQDWVLHQLSLIRPYATAIQRWLVSNGQDDSALLQDDALKRALIWKAGKMLGHQDYEFLEASQQAEQRILKSELRAEQT